MKVFFRLLNFARPFGLFLPQYASLALLSVLFGIANFTLLVPLLDVLFQSKNLPPLTPMPEFSFSVDWAKGIFNHYFSEILAQNGKIGALRFVCVVIVFSVVFSNIFRYFSVVVLNSMRTRVVKNLRQSLFDKITSLHIRYFHLHKKGDILSLFSGDVLEVENSIVGSLTVLLKELIMLIGYFAVLFILSVKLTLFTLIVFPIAGLMISLINKKIKQYAVNSQEVLGSLLTTIEETVSGMRIIKAFNAQSFMNDRFGVLNNLYRMLLKQMWNRRDLASPLSEILGVGIVVSVLLYGGALVIEGEGGITPSQFISFILIYTQVLAPIKTLANTATVIQRGIASGERIFKLLEAENPIVEAENPKSISEIKEGIEFKNVSFSYADRVVLKNISFSIPKGKMVALVGASGSGKSTLSDLLPRFMDVQEGSVCIDGVDIREYKLADLRGLMGIVTQESILFNDTIYSNIVFNNAHATKEEVMEAAKVAHCEEFVNLLPDKYETTIGDRGNRLSGGQRQRLNIARAVLKNPPVLVLDEATSALDNESERLVQDALMKLMVNRTSLVIAHRLSTIQGADEIIVLDQGEIVERGTHDFLMQKQGYYYRMHQK